jgi:hypothetical protein
VRHAWLLGRRQPTLVEVVRVVIDQMGDIYPELRQRSKHIIETTRAEEERFLATIEGGMRRFDELAPRRTTQGSTDMHGTIAGEDAFKLVRHFRPVHMGIGWNGLQIGEQFPKFRAPVTNRLLQGYRLLKGLHGFVESFRSHS